MKSISFTTLLLITVFVYGLICLTYTFNTLHKTITLSNPTFVAGSNENCNEKNNKDLSSKTVSSDEMNQNKDNKVSDEINESSVQKNVETLLESNLIQHVVKSVPANIDAIKTIEFLNSDWNTVYEQKMESIYKNYQLHVPDYIPKPPENSQLSKMYINNTDGVNWGYVYNSCWNTDTKELELYQTVKNVGDLPTKIPPKGYTQLWKMKVIESAIPSNYVVNEEEGNWLLIPVISNHCSHFMETYNFLLHAFVHPNDYPFIKTIYEPLFNIHGERGCNTEYMQLINSVRPEMFPVTTLRMHEIENKVGSTKRLCFRKLGISGIFHYLLRASLFSSPFSVDCIRVQAYKRYSVQLPTSKPKKFNAILIEREKKRLRGLANQKDVEHYFYVKSQTWDFKVIRIERYSVSQQVLMASQLDLVIAVHGGALAIFVYLLPHSSVIEIRPPYFRDRWYYINSKWARINLIPMSNLTSTPPVKCKDVRFEQIGNTLNPDCFKSIHYATSYLNMHLFDEHMNEILVSLNTEKYYVFK